MKDFRGKVAVITGAASGIGRGIAERCAQEGMSVVLADLEEKALTLTEEEMKAAGANVMAVLTDVSEFNDVKLLAQKTLDAFGAVHLLFNNAGVSSPMSLLDRTIADWKWVLGVNLWGVIHGIQAFGPIMLAQNTECHIVNTASVGGLITSPFGIYAVTKHAVVILSEILYLELAERGGKVKVSVLCPGWVKTGIMDSERNRPIGLQNAPAEIKWNPKDETGEQISRKGVETGMSPEQVADYVFNAIRDEKFYILTHPEWKDMVRIRMESILQERNPTIISL